MAIFILQSVSGYIGFVGITTTTINHQSLSLLPFSRLICSLSSFIVVSLLAGSLFVALTYSLMPEKRQNVAIFYALATAVYSFAFVFGSWFAPDKIWYHSFLSYCCIIFAIVTSLISLLSGVQVRYLHIRQQTPSVQSRGQSFNGD
jgi:hypothetical protein